MGCSELEPQNVLMLNRKLNTQQMLKVAPLCAVCAETHSALAATKANADVHSSDSGLAAKVYEQTRTRQVVLVRPF